VVDREILSKPNHVEALKVSCERPQDNAARRVCLSFRRNGMLAGYKKIEQSDSFDDGRTSQKVKMAM
jgi:hypothetical protein